MSHTITPSGRSVNPWWIGLTLTLATFMELLDTSIANVSLPHIAGGLGTSLDEATWVLTSYLVANAVVLPLSAWLSRVFGRKNYYMTCVATFTFSSFLCGVAPNLELLIFFRVLQGIAGGGLAPSEQSMLVDAFPPAKRAAAFGLYSMAIVMAPALGPTLGGWITDNSSWRWIFFINIPVGLVSLFLTSRLVTDPPAFTEERYRIKASGKARIDYLGILLFAIGFGCLEVVLDKGQEDDWFGSSFITTFTVISVVALISAIVWELHHKDPVVDLTLLGNRNFALACGLFFLFGFILFSSTVLLPQLLQTLDRYDATTAGMALTPGALLIVAMAPFIVRLMPIVGPKRLIFIGFVILAVAVWHLGQLDLEADYGVFARARMLQAFGLGFLIVPITQVAYSYLPLEKNNKASSLTNLFRNEGGSFGITFANTILAQRGQFHQSILAQHLTPDNSIYRDWLQHVTSAFMHAGYSAVEAANRAEAQLYNILNEQASLLSYLDCYTGLMVAAGAGVVLALVIKKFAPPGKPADAH
ncbi:MAG TPA: DHA2 family efflux MFS transporter permease subunit [Chthoniobacterales bacterium]|nr:DHA2 family efflux MFS transporter permease subunit [Chthoniobacterales bacterium]